MSGAPKQHPLSALFPPLSAEELVALTGDIRENGLRNPIVLYDGQILDGWNRYQACLAAGVRSIFRTYKGTDPVQFVKSQNWHRRHLTASQRATAVVALNEWHKEGRPGTGPNGPVSSSAKSSAEMATEAGVGVTQVKAAKVVHTRGSQALKEAVKAGQIAVRRAAEIAKLPAQQQPEAMAEAPRPKAPQRTGDYATLKLAYDALQERYEELASNYQVMADDLKTCEAIQAGTVAQEMNSLREQLRQVERRRDELMVQASEMRKQITHWKKLAEKGAEK